MGGYVLVSAASRNRVSAAFDEGEAFEQKCATALLISAIEVSSGKLKHHATR
jgi:hypothetical protein